MYLKTEVVQQFRQSTGCMHIKKLPIPYYIWLELKYTFYANLTCHLFHLHLCKFGMRAGRRVGTSKAWKGLTVWQLEVAT